MTKSHHDDVPNSARRGLLTGSVIALSAASAASFIPSVAGAQTLQQWPAPSDKLDPADAVDPVVPPNLKKNSQVDARFPVSYRRSIPAACRVMTAHFDAIGTRDYAALAKTMHFPFAIIERIDTEFVNSPADLTHEKAPVSLNFEPNGKFRGDNPRTGYSYLNPGYYDIMKSLEVLAFDAAHVNMAMTFDRYNKNGQVAVRCEGVYCVTNNDGKWAIQLMSTIWTPGLMIGTQYPDTIDAALRLRSNHILSYLDDNDIIDHPRPHRSRSGITGGGIGNLLNNMGADDRMASFRVKGVKTRLSGSGIGGVRPVGIATGGGGEPGDGGGAGGGNRGPRVSLNGGPVNPLAADPRDRTPKRDEPKWMSNRPEWNALGYDYGMTSMAAGSRVIHHAATKAHRVAGVTRYTTTGEEMNTSMEVAVIVLGSGGDWTSAGGLRYLTTHDRTNDF